MKYKNRREVAIGESIILIVKIKTESQKSMWCVRRAKT
jgi:hypothetical protein